MKILVTGGARSGKSRHAQSLAESMGSKRLYLATARALDKEMEDRIARHRSERGHGWTTAEAPIDVEPILARGGVIVLDCLTLWVNNLMMQTEDDAAIEQRFDDLIAALEAAPGDVILVTNEVGLGIVPMNAMARRFRDLSGFLSQRVAAVVDEVHLVVVGQVLKIKA